VGRAGQPAGERGDRAEVVPCGLTQASGDRDLARGAGGHSRLLVVPTAVGPGLRARNRSARPRSEIAASVHVSGSLNSTVTPVTPGRRPTPSFTLGSKTSAPIRQPGDVIRRVTVT